MYGSAKLIDFHGFATAYHLSYKLQAKEMKRITAYDQL